MAESRKIKIRIAGIDYPLMAASEPMEQIMRLAAESVNQKLSAYNAKYPDKSMTDKLAFVALNEAIARLTSQKKMSDASQEAAKLQEEVDKYLKDIEKNGR